MTIKLEDVFGVSSKQVKSYIERKDVDDKFVDALKSDKQIVVYGASKQGKTALVSKHLSYTENIVISLGPKTELVDIYASILRQSGIKLSVSETETKGRESKIGFTTKIKALIPIFAEAESGISGESKSKVEKDIKYEEVPFNLAIPQDISELLRKIKNKKFIILENFHYLPDDHQKQFAFDLRTFQELNIQFIILGVWREKNKMIQFNGDLLDRIKEIPVEPWLVSDFEKVVFEGSKHLNIEIKKEIIDKVSELSFCSIGVFQELIKEICRLSGIDKRQSGLVRIESEEFIDTAAREKAGEYTARHQRALEAIAAGNPTSAKDGLIPLFLPYYMVRVILETGYDGIATGMKRSFLQEQIQKFHHRPHDVRASDMSNLLYNLGTLQSNKGISPPIIDFDRNKRSLEVVDSSFYFFLKNSDLSEIISELPNPLEE